MGSTSGIMLRVLINRFHKNPSDAPLQYLPEEKRKSVLSSNIYAKDPSPCLTSSSEQLNAIHYSWLVPALKEFPNTLQEAIIRSLSKSQALKLQQIFNLTKSEVKFPSSMRRLLVHKIYSQVKPEGILPLAYLPETSLSFMTGLTKQQLVEIVDFLGLYDLAESIRHIIDKNFLQKLYKCLSHKQKQFLRICLHQQEKVFSAKMEMNSWNGDCKKLDLMLQRRGLLRLGKAMCGQHPDFMWHIAHRLDSGRGGILLHYYTTEPTPVVTPRLVQQVIALMNFLNPKSNP